MKSYTKSIEELSQDPANARRHESRNLEAIAASLKRFGQQKPIVIDSSGVVRAGNGTLAAAAMLGWETVEVVQTTLQGSEAAAYAIADNRTAELASWDNEVLAATLNAVVEDDPELLAAAGFDAEELAGMMDTFTTNEKTSEPKLIGDVEFRVVIKVEDETQQASLIEKLESEGYQCQALMS